MDISKEDLKNAVDKNLLSSQQADELWHFFAESKNQQPSFNLTNIAYYIGGLLVICAIGWLLAIGMPFLGINGLLAISVIFWLFFLSMGSFLWKKERLKTPGGLFITIAVCMVPWILYLIELSAGLRVEKTDQNGFDLLISNRMFDLEIATILAALLAIIIFPFPFLTVPLFLSALYFTIDIADYLGEKQGSIWKIEGWAFFFFGLGLLIISFFLDKLYNKTKKDFAFWGYIIGTLSFWIGAWITFDRLDKMFIFFLINIALIFLSVLLCRKIMLICGAIGFFAYLTDLAYSLFKDSLLFPFSLIAIGILIIFLGILYSKHHEKIEKWLFDHLPEAVKNNLPVWKE